MTSIEWTHGDGYKGETWNPLAGCSRVSPGCQNCYAERFAARVPHHRDYVRSTSKGPRWTGAVTPLPAQLDKPLRWRKPRMVFVNSMSDLFHEDVPYEYIAAVFGVMAAARDHVFQVLTKRDPRPFFRWVDRDGEAGPECAWQAMSWLGSDEPPGSGPAEWPLPNVWLGVSAEDQSTADARIPLLNNVPARVRFVSYEPALGPLDLEAVPAPPGRRPAQPGGTMDDIRGALSTYQKRDGLMLGHRVDWVIVGGESGHHARPFNLQWARSVRDQCREAGAACFVKQLGSRAVITEDIREVTQISAGHTIEGGVATLRFRDGKGGSMDEWPSDLRVREFPNVG